MYPASGRKRILQSDQTERISLTELADSQIRWLRVFSTGGSWSLGRQLIKSDVGPRCRDCKSQIEFLGRFYSARKSYYCSRPPPITWFTSLSQLVGRCSWGRDGGAPSINSRGTWFFPLSFLLSFSEAAFTDAFACGQLLTAERFSADTNQRSLPTEDQRRSQQTARAPAEVGTMAAEPRQRVCSQERFLWQLRNAAPQSGSS